MSKSKSLTISRLNDAVLGCFSALPPSQTLEHLVRFLRTWGGTDKFFQLLQYTLKVLVPILHFRTRFQHRAGLTNSPTSRAATHLIKLERLISDSRTLFRIWGLLPIVQWMISLERNPQPTRSLLNIERLQGWSMLGYYPLEHLSYLCGHDIIPKTISLPSYSKEIELSPDSMGMWSCRFWAFYVFLQFAHLKEDKQLIQQRYRNFRKVKANGLSVEEKNDFRQQWDAYFNEVIINICNLPLALHWSISTGIFKNDLWVSIFGLVGAIASFRVGWKATDIPLTNPIPDTPVVQAPESIVDL